MEVIGTTEDARKYFEEKGLSYKIVNRKNIDILIGFLNKELKEHDSNFPMRLSKIVHYNSYMKPCPSEMNHCHLYVNGGYFKKRQAISFEGNGFIGFAGWASTNNIQPFVRAFIKWCDWMVENSDVVYTADESEVRE